jgi:hypothetical protein
LCCGVKYINGNLTSNFEEYQNSQTPVAVHPAMYAIRGAGNFVTSSDAVGVIVPVTCDNLVTRLS